MKLLMLACIFSVFSLIFAEENQVNKRKRHGKGRNRAAAIVDIDNDNYHGLTVHENCKRSGLVALTFDDGVA